MVFKQQQEVIESLQKNITLILHAHLRHYTGNKNITLQIPENETLEQTLSRLEVPLSEVTVFIIDGKKVYEDFIPKDKDIIEVIPAISGG